MDPKDAEIKRLKAEVYRHKRSATFVAGLAVLTAAVSTLSVFVSLRMSRLCEQTLKQNKLCTDVIDLQDIRIKQQEREIDLLKKLHGGHVIQWMKPEDMRKTINTWGDKTMLEEEK